MALLKNRAGSCGSIVFSSLSLLSSLGARQRDIAGRVSLALLGLFILFSAISLARPQKQNSPTERKASGIDIIIAMDVSTSMLIKDLRFGRRIEPRDHVAREVVKGFIKLRPNDRIGLIPFAGQPYQESPITLEHEWLLSKIDQVKPSRDLSQGTAIGSAISASAIRLDKRKDTKSRIIVLLTDGSNNSGKLSPLQAAEAAKTLGIKVYTVGIGTKEGRLTSQHHTTPEFDTKTLQRIAEITGAEYYRAKSTKDLKDAFSSIDQLEKTERTQNVVTTYETFHHYFTFAAAACLLGHLIILSFHKPAGPE